MKKQHLWLIAAILTAFSNMAYAQIAKPVLKLTKGDGYKITTYINTSTRLQRGDRNLELLSVASISKMYKVANATDAGYELTATVTHITDTLNAFGKNVSYSSDRAPKPNAEIEAGLSTLINKTATIKLDKSGIITGVSSADKAPDDDNILALAGLPIDSLPAGKMADIFFNPNAPAGTKVGSSWKIIDKRNGGNITTTVTIKASDANQIMFGYAMVAKQPSTNANINGLVLVDRASGMVLRRSVKTSLISIKNVNDQAYVESKKMAVEEVCELAK